MFGISFFTDVLADAQTNGDHTALAWSAPCAGGYDNDVAREEKYRLHQFPETRPRSEA